VHLAGNLGTSSRLSAFGIYSAAIGAEFWGCALGEVRDVLDL